MKAPILGEKGYSKMLIYKEKEIAIKESTSGIELARSINLNDPNQAIIMLVNDSLKDLSTTISPEDRVEILDFSTPLGKEVFWHSSAHVLAQAIVRLYPEAIPTIGPPIENGFYYDFDNLDISDKDFPKIEKEIKKILKENHKPQRCEIPTKEEALEKFGSNPFKKELINEFPNDAEISSYTQGEFTDLCRGPHLHSLGKIKAFKILKTSAAYWRGDNSQKMLTRVYAISFPSKDLLQEYLTFIEESIKRDHRKIGKDLLLFSFYPWAAGMPLFKPKGMIIWNKLLNYWHKLHKKDGYLEIKTPILMDKELWEQSGHWDYYKENMYTSIIDDRVFAIKPMNCPPCMHYFNSSLVSYKDLPLKIGEIGHVHRHELSGSLSGLFRVRSFHQDDAHIFMTPNQITDQIVGVLELVDTIYQTFGLNYHLELSTRPEKAIGTDEDWDLTTKGLQTALELWKEKKGITYVVNEGDGAFYGPKIDLHVKDTLKRSWQCGTIQLDMSLPERFNLNYIDNNGEKKRPIMIHRALFGSIERFLGILIEHFEGKFPLWLSPEEVRVLPVATKHNSYASSILNTLIDHDFEAKADLTHEKLGYRIRSAQVQKVNYMLILGDQEEETNTVSIRLRTGEMISSIPLPQFIEKLSDEKKKKSLTSAFS